MPLTTIKSSNIKDSEIKDADISPTASITESKITGLDAAQINANAFNIGVLGFKMAVSEGLTIFNLVDGVVDEFNDESGIDTGENSNASYDASSDFYQNLGAATPNPVPQSTFSVFTSPGTYNNPSTTVTGDILIVAGGGGGADGQGGGGGAGGIVFGENVTLTQGASFPITVGSGGTGGDGTDPNGYNSTGAKGGDSTFTFPTPLVVTAIGGGGGLQNNYGYPTPLNSTAQGGSSGGAGGGGIGSGSAGVAIPKLTQPVPSDFTAFGNNGGAQGNTGSGGGGGGGGAGGAGEAGGGNGLGDAGAGQPFTDFPGPVLSPLPTIPSPLATAIGPTGVFGGGGGGSLGTGFSTRGTHPSVGGGGAGGSGNRPGISPAPDQKDGYDGVDGTGGGGGGAGGPAPPASGGDGGNGIVIIRQATTQATASTMTLISDTFTANSTPSKARMVVFAELPDGLSDFTTSVTRDNTNFDAITLTDEGFVTGSSGTKIFTGSTPLTGAAGGQPQVQLRWKIVGSSLSGNNKIHGVALQWS